MAVTVDQQKIYDQAEALRKQASIAQRKGDKAQVDLLQKQRFDLLKGVPPKEPTVKIMEGTIPPGSLNIDQGQSAPAQKNQPIQPIQQQPAMPTATASFQRDQAREQATVNKLGFVPQTAEDIASAARMTYTPDEIAQMDDATRQQLGLINQQNQNLVYDPNSLQALGLTPEQIAALGTAGGQANQAAELLASTNRPTNSALRVLQEALNAKKNVTNQPLGQSELFSQAGLPSSGVAGYAILSQSLAQRGKEMEQTYDSFKRTVSDVAEAQRDTYQLALDKYALSKGLYDQQVDRLLKINEVNQKNQQAIDLLEKQHQNSIELAKLNSALNIQELNAKTDPELAALQGGVAGSILSSSKILGATITQKFDTDINYSIPGQREGKHDGLDYVLPGGMNANVETPVAGIVTKVEKDNGNGSGWGNSVLIEDESGNVHRFSHLSAVTPDLEGQAVLPGTILGKQGNTGYTKGKTGIHVDYRIQDPSGQYIDPEPFLSGIVESSPLREFSWVAGAIEAKDDSEGGKSAARKKQAFAQAVNSGDVKKAVGLAFSAVFPATKARTELENLQNYNNTLQNLQESIDEFQNITQGFNFGEDDKLSEVTGLGVQTLNRLKIYLGVDQADAAVRLQQRVAVLTNNYIKTITGATVGVEEAPRLMAALPSLDLPASDFKIKLEELNNTYRGEIDNFLSVQSGGFFEDLNDYESSFAELKKSVASRGKGNENLLNDISFLEGEGSDSSGSLMDDIDSLYRTQNIGAITSKSL